jgi:hypothetical protein
MFGLASHVAQLFARKCLSIEDVNVLLHSRNLVRRIHIEVSKAEACDII